MSVLSYVHSRECGGLGKQTVSQQKQMEQLLEEKVTESFINKACSVSGHCRSTFITEFSPDGTKVASTHGDHSVRVTDIATGRCVRTLRGHARTPWCLAYHTSSPNILASGCLAGQVRIWDLYGFGCEVWQTENSSVIAALTFHPVDHVLIIASGNTIYLWDWSKPEPFAKCSTKYDFERIRWVRFDHLGHYLYTGISNNTAAYRTETPSLQSNREHVTASSNPSTLVNAYDSIVNTYHEYRQDSILDAGTYSNLNTYIGTPQRRTISSRTNVRDNELLLASYASRLSQQARQDLEHRSPISMTGRESALMNTTNDPFLPSIGGESEESDREAVVWQDRSLLSAGSSSAQGISMDNDTAVRLSRSQPVITQSTSHALERLTSALDTASEIEYSSSVISRSAYNNTNNNDEQLFSSSEQQGQRKTFSLETPPCTSYSQNVAEVHAHKKVRKSISSQGNQLKTKRQYTDPPTTLSAGIDFPGNAIRDTPRSKPMLLSQYLSKCRSSQSSTVQRPAFQNIRERLQTTIPLESAITGATPGCIRVISASDTTGIPSVTVISSRNTSTETTGSSCSIPSVTVLSRNNQQSKSNVPLMTNGSGVTAEIPAIAAVSVCDISTSARQMLTAVSQVSLVSSQPLAHNVSFLAPSSETLTRHISTRDSGVELETSVNSRRVGQLLNEVMCIESQLQAVASDAGLSQNAPLSSSSISQTFHAQSSANAVSGRGAHDCNEFSSLMGPYLLSRGVTVDETSTLPATSASSFASLMSSVISSSSSTYARDMFSSQTSRIEETSATLSEMDGSTLPPSSYLLPIPSHPAPTTVISSANACRISQNILQEVPMSHDAEQDVEVMIDYNENYSTTAAANGESDRPSISVQDQDTNNNSIHILTTNNTVPQAPESNTPGNTNTRHDFTSLRNCFDLMTNQMEREMHDLSRRITALRDTFNSHLGVLRGEGNGFRRIRSGPMAETDTNLITHSDSELDVTQPTYPLRHHSISQSTAPSNPCQQRRPGTHDSAVSAVHLDRQDNEDSTSDGFVSQPPTLLESSLRSHVARRGRRLYNVLSVPESDDEVPAAAGDREEETGYWRQLQRHTLHPHYSTSILDDAINRPNNAIQSAINRAIAGAFMGSGESAVANNIISQTHRIQFWDFTKYQLPDLTNSSQNVVVPHCKLHNTASCDISQTSHLLATFVPSHNGFPDDNILAVYSLSPHTLGQCLYTKSFGPNAISISISPQGTYVLVGLAAKRLTWVFTSRQLIGQIFKLDRQEAGENSMKHVRNVMHTCNTEVRSHVSGNSARWLPISGMGLVYGTNRGDLYICTHGVKKVAEKMNKTELEDQMAARYPLHQSPWLSFPQRVSTSTQTTGVRQSASTQTDEHEDIQT